MFHGQKGGGSGFVFLRPTIGRIPKLGGRIRARKEALRKRYTVKFRYNNSRYNNNSHYSNIFWADNILLPLNNAFCYNNIFAITIFLRVTKDIVIAKHDCTYSSRQVTFNRDCETEAFVLRQVNRPNPDRREAKQDASDVDKLDHFFLLESRAKAPAQIEFLWEEKLCALRHIHFYDLSRVLTTRLNMASSSARPRHYGGEKQSKRGSCKIERKEGVCEEKRDSSSVANWHFWLPEKQHRSGIV